MSDDLVERVARELRAFYSDEPVAVCDGVAFKAARAAIAVCMEEAAKVCDEYSADEMKFFDEEGGLAALGRANAAEDLAAAIRAMIKEPSGASGS